jgi:ubiquinone/menaquinone biosynthesis C-methylase UbiE
VNPKDKQFDPAGYKNRQRQQWNQVAAGWRQWWPLFERGAQPACERLVSLANVQTGHKVLDVATGIGEPALTAAQRVGPSGHVMATDQAQEMLAIAQERAADAGLQNITFQQMDAETLNLPEGTFDVILCRWGLMFLPDLTGALAQMRQLLRPGGRLATACWDVPAQVPMLTLAMRVIRQFIDVPPPPAEAPNPFSLADVTAFERTLTQAGFVEVQHERLTLTWDFDSAEEFVLMVQDTAAPILALLANRPAEQQTEIWQAIESETIKLYMTEDGRIGIPSEAICVVARH